MDMIEIFNYIKSKSKEELEQMYILCTFKNCKLKYKLKKIEAMYESRTIDLEELRKILMEDE